MNPLVKKLIGSLVRWVLTLIVPFLVSMGIWTGDEATEFTAGLIAAGTALVWSLWQKYGSRVEFVNALNAPKGTPEDVVKAMPAPTVVAQKVIAVILAVGLASTSAACASRLQRAGQPIAPEAEVAVRVTQLVGALNALTVPAGASPVERLVAAKVITTQDALVVATAIKEAMTYAKDLGLVLEVSLASRDEAERERGFMRAAVLVRSIANRLAAAPISIGTPEARKAVVDLLSFAGNLLLTVGSIFPAPAPEGPPPDLFDASFVQMFAH